MEKPASKWPHVYVRWSKAGWPVLSMKPDPEQKAELKEAKQEWDAEGGAIKPSTLTEVPKLPL